MNFKAKMWFSLLDCVFVIMLAAQFCVCFGLMVLTGIYSAEELNGYILGLELSIAFLILIYGITRLVFIIRWLIRHQG
ncbi:MAG: hypothetical protein A2Y89_03095 [Chloroflexi bacterium RBG_13_51_18]|nr:MAG: hypothetical protein A2Y89_03095 [Chloroflexi bacterium RBG_13_51_18]